MQFSSVYILYGTVNGDVITEVDYFLGKYVYFPGKYILTNWVVYFMLWLLVINCSRHYIMDTRLYGLETPIQLCATSFLWPVFNMS